MSKDKIPVELSGIVLSLKDNGELDRNLYEYLITQIAPEGALGHVWLMV
jgi:hypothetical protein